MWNPFRYPTPLEIARRELEDQRKEERDLILRDEKLRRRLGTVRAEQEICARAQDRVRVAILRMEEEEAAQR